VKVLYYDCFSGISGDMNLAAMIELGVDVDYLEEGIRALGLGEDVRLGVRREARKGITGTKVDVIAPDSHHSRTYTDIVALITKSSLPERVKERSIDIFTRLGRAEAGVHGTTLEEVHFHEVGALDSIVDVVGAALCFEYLDVDKVISSPVQVGGGMVRCAHGTFPVPAPATAELLTGIPVRGGAVQSETTTPTGAAILASIVVEFTDSFDLTIDAIGYGLGTKDLEIPNLLRACLCHDDTTGGIWATGHAMMAECNIDDMNPEQYEHLSDKLFEAGASDVFYTPIIMKKGRPATKVGVLYERDLEHDILSVVFKESTTLGIRTHPVTKHMLNRTYGTVHTPFGDITVKIAFLGSECVHMKPEYEQCRQRAQEHGVSLQRIYEEVYRSFDGCSSE
jgi:hypothetical protein